MRWFYVGLGILGMLSAVLLFHIPNYPEIRQAKTITVNAVSSAEPGGKRKRSEPITVQLHPVFLTDRFGKSQKIQEFEYHESISNRVVAQINHFLAGEQSTLIINLLDENSGSTNGTQRDYILIHTISSFDAWQCWYCHCIEEYCYLTRRKAF